MKLSIFDHGYRIEGVQDRDVIDFAVSCAVDAERHGFHRIWYGTSYDDYCCVPCPDLLMMPMGYPTNKIRVGIGGMMALYHDPLEMVNRFTMIDAFTDGRLDVAFGATRFAETPITVRTNNYFDVIDQYLFFAEAGFANVDGKLPQIFICAISPGMSASYAAAKGLPLATTTLLSSGSDDKTAATIAYYRENFVPGVLEHPYSILVTNAVVGASADHVRHLARSQAYVITETNRTKKVPLLKDPDSITIDLNETITYLMNTQLYGTPLMVRDKLLDLQCHTLADEIMLHFPIADLNDKLNSIKLIGPGA